ncbi:response regulator transcription factor [Nitrosococcus watsonii]|uniref:Two component transcriptional regulator, LuxR family n=1 Tax=Nitrosococcus watsoni (strain C-113) TaxID=105559 RepID=D8K676_NITWC|nr:LuxR C-terminal-related transcriptional regulator [Nitrosococcus watsonii]ADJ28403.1 two component transcriptional regulator, LuxR family [Nitrosococcus watsonii C-113]
MQSEKPAVFMVGINKSLYNKLVNPVYSTGLAIEKFESAKSFLDSNCWKKLGCVLLEFSLQGINGLALQRRLQALGSRIPIILMVEAGEITYAVQALKQGAIDVLEKPAKEQIILNTIYKAANQALALWRQQKQVETAHRCLTSLTLREKQILDLVLEGRLNKVIAFDLEISMKTVEAHRHSIMQKLKVKNLPELIDLVRMADRRGVYYYLQSPGAATLAT